MKIDNFCFSKMTNTTYSFCIGMVSGEFTIDDQKEVNHVELDNKDDEALQGDLCNLFTKNLHTIITSGDQPREA